MKYIILFVISLCTIGFESKAQVHAYDNNHVGISYAFYNPMAEDMKSEGLTIDRNTGTIGLDFTYGIIDRVALGMQLGYGYISSDLISLNYKNENYLVKYSANYFQLWLKGDYHFAKNNFYEGTFYSSFALGYMSTSSTRENQVGIDQKDVPKLRDLVYSNGVVYQFYPIGYKREFRKSFGGFIELGYGYQGFGRLGLYVRIDRSGKKMK